MMGLGAVLLILAVILGMWAFGWWMPGMGGMGPHMGGRPQTSAPAATPPVAGASTIAVEAADFSFRPAELRVATGRAVNIILANRGAIFHDLTIPALRFQLSAQPGQLREASLLAAVPGTYEFYCSVPGHREAGMVGRIVVAP